MNAPRPVFAFLIMTILATAALASPIANPTEPANGRQTIALQEVWRAGGEDDDVFFGSVQRVLSGPDGTVLVLDNQLSQVQVYDADGQWQRTLGREGEGPGEARNPSDAFYLPDGRLCLAQGFPGRLVYLNADGTPGGQGHYTSMGEPATFTVLVTGRSAPRGMLLTGIRMNQGGGPIAQQTYFLSLCDTTGAEQVVYMDKQTQVNYADFRMDEMAMDFLWGGRMNIDTEGRVYTAPDRNSYMVRVQNVDGTVLREFSRAVTIPERDAEARALEGKILEGIASNYPVPLQGITMEDTEPAITGLWVRPDGEVWVQTPANERPEGAFTLLDVFDSAGVFTHQVVIDVPGDPDRDGLHMLADGRIAMVIGGLDAWLSQQGVESSSEDAPVLEVICYETN